VNTYARPSRQQRSASSASVNHEHSEWSTIGERKSLGQQATINTMKRESAAFLATYRPLCRTAQGRRAITKYSLPPYVDGSCRREPDLEAHFPTITALCRGRMFAPRLYEGDRVAYVTKQGRYGLRASLHWRLTALLLVEHRFESHPPSGSVASRPQYPNTT